MKYFRSYGINFWVEDKETKPLVFYKISALNTYECVSGCKTN